MRLRTSDRYLEEHMNRAYRYALALTNDSAAAEDLVQDAWLVVLDAGNTRHFGYFLRAIRNRFFDVERHEGLVLIEPAGDASDGDAVLDLDDDVIDAGAPLDKALSALRAEERELLYLASVEGYTAKEIGELQGRPAGTVLSLATRARQRLRSAARHFSSRSLP